MWHAQTHTDFGQGKTDKTLLEDWWTGVLGCDWN